MIARKPEAADKACWSCKARKVRCDKALPGCRRCADAKRDCEGYGFRLSWPRSGDRKRASTATPSSARLLAATEKAVGLRYVNTTSWDIELHRRLSMARGPQIPRQIWPYRSLRDRHHPHASTDELTLVHYFHDVAHGSLVTFDADYVGLRDAIMRLALTPTGAPRRGLLYSLLALSSIRRKGLQREALEFKVLALRALSASATGRPLSPAEAIQHVAACMLLGDFEILIPSETSGEWILYLRGATDIIKGTGLEEHSGQSDIGTILDWVHYHDTVSRFTTRHWMHKSVERGDGDGSKTLSPYFASLSRDGLALRSRNPTHSILDVLADACDVLLLDPDDPRRSTAEYKSQVQALEARVQRLVDTTGSLDCSGSLPSAESMYQISTLIYLSRATGARAGSGGGGGRLGNLARSIMDSHTARTRCHHMFPLFILACEARTEEQRAAILDLIHHMEQPSNAGRIELLRHEIQAVWVQLDLYQDVDLLEDYLGLMSAVVSSSRTLPSFV